MPKYTTQPRNRGVYFFTQSECVLWFKCSQELPTRPCTLKRRRDKRPCKHRQPWCRRCQSRPPVSNTIRRPSGKSLRQGHSCKQCMLQSVVHRSSEWPALGRHKTVCQWTNDRKILAKTKCQFEEDLSNPGWDCLRKANQTRACFRGGKHTGQIGVFRPFMAYLWTAPGASQFRHNKLDRVSFWISTNFSSLKPSLGSSYQNLSHRLSRSNCLAIKQPNVFPTTPPSREGSESPPVNRSMSRMSLLVVVRGGGKVRL